MPRKRTPKRKIRDFLQLKWTAQQSNRALAKSCAIARSTFAKCLERAADVDLSWPLPDGLDDTVGASPLPSRRLF